MTGATGDPDPQVIPVDAVRNIHLYLLARPLRVVPVAAGMDHSLFLTNDGDVLSCGDGDYGRLGHGNEEDQLVPKLVAALEGRRVVQVAASGCHSLFLAEGGAVLSCGSGHNGQLGHGDKENQLTPKLVVALEGRRVVQVAAGDAHSLFLTKGGAVLSCGDGHNGLLGHGDHETQFVPKLVAGLEGRRVVQVAAGEYHSLFLTEGGAVLSCGDGDHGPLGHGDEETQLVPKPVAALEGWCVVQVAAGGAHSLFLAEGGAVLSCGYGCDRQLGHGDKETQLVPKVVVALEGRRVVQVAAGDYHSLFLAEGGAVLSCGEGAYGPLGHGDEYNQLVPKLVAALEGRCVVQVAAGKNHSLFLAKDGAVLSCGDGQYGKLGNGNQGEHHVPKEVVL